MRSEVAPVDAAVLESLKRRRIASLIGSFIVACSAGVNYAFSSFAPQLQEQLQLTSTQINVVGVAGNMGVYLSGPFWGRWVDKQGPKVALLVGSALVLAGFGGLSLSYTHTAPFQDASPSTLAVLSLLTGLGNAGAFTAAMNAQAKSWDGNRRGSATALVLSGFGLSAFLYSTLSHQLFPGNTSDYLLLLAFGCAASFLVGVLLIRILPPADANPLLTRRGSDGRGAWTQAPAGDDEEIGRLEQNADVDEDEDEERGRLRPHVGGRRRTSSEVSARAFLNAPPTDEDTTSADEEDMNTRAMSPATTPSNAGAGATPEGNKGAPSSVDVTNFNLLKQADFLLLFLIMSLISGTGLLVINNIGTITRTLFEYNKGRKDVPEIALDAQNLPRELIDILTKDEKAIVQQAQAHQVSAISLGNASGRIIMGLLSDLFVSSTGDARMRVWLLVLVCILAVGSQALAAAPNTITTVHRLIIISLGTGWMYGALFGLAPVLTFEWFGLKHFSQNWGYVSLSPVIAGNIFNLLFGKIYDSHVSKGSGSVHQCPLGEECYRSVFEITEVCALAAAAASFLLIVRRTRDVQRVRNPFAGFYGRLSNAVR
ncbi:MFS general substrate transporter [Ceraceosorus guamensis]|uniref:MFS general substrate transporter n=1 Tax=Ceraceosorus guamensis TaxID=1522189 RepID=A0A316W5Q1_9BASI|nr:MFS general substrate transporter [Ceraceosorus guamensis]PWN44418.1 MFS general substrate transporter [Ceraceosorus guamensis]